MNDRKRQKWKDSCSEKSILKDLSEDPRPVIQAAVAWIKSLNDRRIDLECELSNAKRLFFLSGIVVGGVAVLLYEGSRSDRIAKSDMRAEFRDEFVASCYNLKYGNGKSFVGMCEPLSVEIELLHQTIPDVMESRSNYR